MQRHMKLLIQLPARQRILRFYMRTTDNKPNATRKLLHRITMVLFRGAPIVARQRRTTMAH